jgi:Oxidoreductase molybdopterin binding domain
MQRRAWLGLALLAALSVRPAWSADAPGLTVVASDGTTKTLSIADIAALPSRPLDITFETEHGQSAGHYTGPLLWTVLDNAHAIPPGARSHVRVVVTTTGSDGYTAVLALAEIDPAFEGKTVLLATQQDGKPVSGTGLRLVVPADKHGGRSVHDVVRIAVSG